MPPSHIAKDLTKSCARSCLPALLPCLRLLMYLRCLFAGCLRVVIRARPSLAFLSVNTYVFGNGNVFS